MESICNCYNFTIAFCWPRVSLVGLHCPAAGVIYRSFCFLLPCRAITVTFSADGSSFRTVARITKWAVGWCCRCVFCCLICHCCHVAFFCYSLCWSGFDIARSCFFCIWCISIVRSGGFFGVACASAACFIDACSCTIIAWSGFCGCGCTLIAWSCFGNHCCQSGRTSRRDCNRIWC